MAPLCRCHLSIAVPFPEMGRDAQGGVGTQKHGAGTTLGSSPPAERVCGRLVVASRALRCVTIGCGTGSATGNRVIPDPVRSIAATAAAQCEQHDTGNDERTSNPEHPGHVLRPGGGKAPGKFSG